MVALQAGKTVPWSDLAMKQHIRKSTPSPIVRCQPHDNQADTNPIAHNSVAQRVQDDSIRFYCANCHAMSDSKRQWFPFKKTDETKFW
eukprot:11989945-Karenia_brevis.AAC.1